MAVAGVVVCGLGQGCARAPKQTTPSAILPSIDLSEVAKAHLFAGELPMLRNPQALSLQTRLPVPGQVPLLDLSEAQPLSESEIGRIERGLKGRLALVNSRYAASLREREERSAQVAVRQAREKLAPEIDQRRQQINQDFAKKIVNAQLASADEKRKLLFEISILRSQIRALPGGDSAALQQKLNDKQARVEAIAKTVAQNVGGIRRQHQLDLKQVEEDFEAEIAALEKREMAQARERAEQLASQRAEATLNSVNSFVSALGRRHTDVTQSAGKLSIPPSVRGSVASNSSVLVRDFQSSAQKLRAKIVEDARISESVVEASAPLRRGGATKKAVTNRASHLVSGR